MPTPPTAQKATKEQAKQHNKRFILKTIYDQGEISRAGIARVTRLTRPTVSNIVAELSAEGLVEEVGQKPSRGGKPATLLSVVDDSRHLIGVDIGNSEFRGAVLDLRGRVKHRLELPVEGRDGEAALESVYTLIDELVAVAESPLLGIGIGAPGLMDASRGVVRHAVNLDWQDLPLGSLLRQRYGLSVYIANDSQAAALGEYIFGRGKGTANLVVVKVDRGIGSGIVINGRLYYGDGFGAGEIGHVVVVEGGEPCRCGHFGCLETVASNTAIVRRAQAIAINDLSSTLHRFVSHPEKITLDTVLQALETGDETLQRVVAEAGRYLGIAVANLVSVLDIQRIVITGSVARFGDVLLEPIRQEMHQRCLAALADETHVEASNLGRDIVILGAAALLLTYELGVV